MTLHFTEQNDLRLPRLLRIPSPAPSGAWLLERLGCHRPLVVPGAFDGISARLIEENGFEAAYCSGYAAAASGYGQPDLGVLSAEEMWAVYRRIRDATSIPLIVDADTGHGGLLNVARTMRDLQCLGVTAIQIEDQVNPKHCGFSDAKRLVSVDEAALRIRAAVEAVGPGGPAIIGRTDALRGEGIRSAIERARRYRDEGASIIFVDAPRSIAELESIRACVDGPLMFNATTVDGYPDLGIDDIAAIGYNLIIYPVLPLYAAYAAIDYGLKSLLTGQRVSSESNDRALPTMGEVDAILEAPQLLSWLDAIQKSPPN